MNKITTKGRKIEWVKLSIFCLSFLFFQLNTYAQDAPVEEAVEETTVEEVSSDAAGDDGALIAEGEKLFKANCAACHSVGTNKVVGPGLQGINDKRSAEWLEKWIINSGELIASGDADAVAIFEEYNKVPMPPQPVSPEQVKSILAYIKNPPVKESAVAEDAVVEEVEEDSSINMYIFIGLAVVLLIMVLLLNKARVSVAKLVATEKGEKFHGPFSVMDALKYTISNNKGLVAALVIVLFFVGLVGLLNNALEIGVHQDYMPEQPIKFSHKIHAGDDKIDCNYCHSSARHSKTSGIPSLNVCMNCHKYIDGSHGKTFMYNGEEYSMEDEIKKIYTALDYDPSTQTYGDNPQPVKWIKVHNLPDHVFYSHSQHVTAGKQKCQTCHGPVEEMEVVKQYSPLTMGWCIECHRETKVSTEGNGYYEDMHSRMPDDYKHKVMADDKITVDEIGGLECAKCHY